MALIEAAETEQVAALLRPHIVHRSAAPGLIAQPLAPVNAAAEPDARETFGERSRRYRSGWFDLICFGVLLAMLCMALWA